MMQTVTMQFFSNSAIIGRDFALFKNHLFKFIYAMPAVSAWLSHVPLGDGGREGGREALSLQW